jgi:hypothetical protein
MTQKYDINGMMVKIKALRKNAEALKDICGDIPTVVKNCDRILADVKMLEININDVADILNK